MTILDSQVELIESLIKNNQSKEACFEFSKLIKYLEQKNDKNLPEFYYKYAMILFDNFLYEDCIIMLHNAYKNNYMKKEIKEFILNCFITPNLDEYEIAYNKNLSIYTSKNKYSNLQNIDIDYYDLSLEFIPVNEDKYYIFDTQADTFNSIINLNDEKIQDNISFRFNDEFSDILIIDNDDIICDISRFLDSNTKKTIYYISKDPSRILSFFKLSNIANKYFDNIVIFDSPDMLYNFFRTNPSIYLPHTLITGNSNSSIDLGEKIQRILDEEHKFRISHKGRNDNNILLSICIPTWNRGHRALDCVTSLLKSYYDSEIEIIISNNNSTEYLDCYEKINNIPDSRIKYFKSELNTGYIGNFCKVLELSKGKFSLILSDEDKVDLEALPHYMALLKNNPNLGLVRSGSTETYFNLTNEYFQAGNIAFLNVFLSTNYMPGIIYNNYLIHTHNLTKFIKDNKSNIACYIYPHMWLDALISFKGDFCTDSTVLCIEGTSELEAQINKQDKNINELDISSDIAGSSIPTVSGLENLPIVCSYQNRIEQHFGFTEFIRLLQLDSVKIIFDAYVSLCYKTNFLVNLYHSTYINAGYSWNNIYDELFNCCVDGLDRLGIDIDPAMKYLLIDYIRKDNQMYRI